MAVIDTSIQKESQDRYLTYAMSVVSGRALPDVRDGLKPVQRRILFAMLNNLRLTPQGSHRKSAKVVGEVLACYHPHGDVACYDAMVRMAQEFSLRYPLVDGQGNFGSMDGDEAAAYRYTEAKLRDIALDVIGEIDEETVGFRDNFDSTMTEPMVLPSRVPNLLINGASGIAVGMATSIPPHNLTDIIEALLELLADPEVANSRLTTVVKAPDFPSGCQILNTRQELVSIYETGQGAVRMRGEWSIEDEKRGKRIIVISSIPYAINKAQLVEKIADLIIQKKVPQLVDIRDESTTDVRIVLELASDADADRAMAYLFKHTPLESSFPVNLTALVPTAEGALRPEVLSLKSCLQHFLDFRHEVVQKKLSFERKKLLERIHILEGLVKVFDALDEALKIVRKSDGRSDAAHKLEARFKLTEIQAFAVVDMKIYQLSRTNIEEIRAELDEKEARVKEIDAILKSKAKISEIVKRELKEIADKHGDRRRCKLVKDNIEIEINEDDYVIQEDVYAIVTADGWIKRIRQNNELSSTRLREGDSIVRAHPLNTVDWVVFFTNLGSVYSLRVSDFPSSSGYGDPIQKVLKFKDGEQIAASFGLASGDPKQASLLASYPHMVKEGDEVTLLTKQGMGFILKLEGLSGIKRNGKRVMKVRDGDKLTVVTPAEKKIAMFTQRACGLVIDRKELPVRDSAVIGVIAMGVRDDDALIGAISYSSSATAKITNSDGKVIELKSSEITAGKRALKGTKVIGRGEIASVEKA